MNDKMTSVESIDEKRLRNESWLANESL